MKNRYGDSYQFIQVDNNTYTIEGDLKYWRYGGREGQHSVDLNDLGYVDPSGGPFISLGCIIEGKKITKIKCIEDKIYFEVE
jgi:hypothetical protein